MSDEEAGDELTLIEQAIVEEAITAWKLGQQLTDVLRDALVSHRMALLRPIRRALFNTKVEHHVRVVTCIDLLQDMKGPRERLGRLE